MTVQQAVAWIIKKPRVGCQSGTCLTFETCDVYQSTRDSNQGNTVYEFVRYRSANRAEDARISRGWSGVLEVQSCCCPGSSRGEAFSWPLPHSLHSIYPGQ